MPDFIVHDDAEAGVRFPVPFNQPIEKTAAQVEGLILEEAKATIPEGARFTSGVYSKNGVPYLLVWTRADRVPPSQADLASMEDLFKFDRAALRGVTKDPLPAKSGLKTLLLTQIAKGETIQVGYFYRANADRALFDQVAAGFELTTAKRMNPDELPSGPSNHDFLAIGLIAFAIGFLAVVISRRVYLRRSAPG